MMGSDSVPAPVTGGFMLGYDYWEGRTPFVGANAILRPGRVFFGRICFLNLVYFKTVQGYFWTRPSLILRENEYKRNC